MSRPVVALTALLLVLRCSSQSGGSGAGKPVAGLKDSGAPFAAPDAGESPVTPEDAGVWPTDGGPNLGADSIHTAQDDDASGECGYGVIVGIVCSPTDQVFVNGATIWVDATGCDGQPAHLETVSDGQGLYTLTGVPSGMQTVHVQKGTYSHSYTVLIEGGKTTDVTSVGKKACAQVVSKCGTGTIQGNVCPAGKLGGDGAGLTVYVIATYCGNIPIYQSTTTAADGSFQLSGVPVGDQTVVIKAPTMSINQPATVGLNLTTKLGNLSVVQCDDPDPGCGGNCDEPCDCMDNDGDGQVDEGCGIFWKFACIDPCDCEDNDKDGQIDEDCWEKLECGAQACDCIDNNGDGVIDEGCCTPGDVRYCDENIYCSWGKQSCKPDGSWTKCQEIPVADIPPDCQPAFPQSGDPIIYDKTCCIAAGLCCQDYPKVTSTGYCSAPSCP